HEHEAGDFERGAPVAKELIKRKPDSALLHAILGVAEARQGRWAEAAAAYRRAAELAPADAEHGFRAAALLAHLGDRDGYGEGCRHMIDRFGTAADLHVADITAKSCLLRPDAVADPGAVQKLADRLVTGTEGHEFYRWFVLAKGLADYRAGRDAE